MDFDEFSAKSEKHLSEIPINEESSLLEYAVYLELLLNGPFVVWDENGEYTLLRIKARVDVYRNLIITINPKEHPPPHFHVHSENVNASFMIKDCSLLAGDIRPHDLKKIKYWYSLSSSREKLIEVWNKTRPTKCVVGKICE